MYEDPEGRLVYLYGAMDSGKSLGLLVAAYQAEKAGKNINVLTNGDRSAKASVTSRIGLERLCEEYSEETSMWSLYHNNIDMDQIYVDEAQFLTESQVEELAGMADSYIEVFCYGLLTDFKSELFPGSKRLIELADEIVCLQSGSLCWCGRPARYNARVEDNEVIYDGPQIMLGDVDQEIGYAVLCRKHYTWGELG